jgi:hypothetical protein
VALAAVGFATLDHGEQPGSVPLPAVFDERPDVADREATVRLFRAEQAHRLGDVDEAIRLHEHALALMPDAPGLQLALARCLLQRRVPDAGESQSADCRMAANLAAAARATLRRWRMSSTDAAELLLQARMLSEDPWSAARTATAEPDGEAAVPPVHAPFVEVDHIGARVRGWSR